MKTLIVIGAYLVGIFHAFAIDQHIGNTFTRLLVVVPLLWVLHYYNSKSA